MGGRIRPPSVATGFLEGTSNPEPNTPTATRPTHRHPEARTSPGPPSCQCRGSITPVREAAESGRRYPPGFVARALDLRTKIFGRPTNWEPHYPPFARSRAWLSGPRLCSGVRCSNWSTGPIRPLRGPRLTLRQAHASRAAQDEGCRALSSSGLTRGSFLVATAELTDGKQDPRVEPEDDAVGVACPLRQSAMRTATSPSPSD